MFINLIAKMSGKNKYKSVSLVGDDLEENTLEPIKKRNLFNRHCVWSSIGTCTLIAIYFAPSIGLTFYQRWFLQKYKFPLTVVLIHLVIKYLLATLIRSITEFCTKKPRVLLGWKMYMKSVLPVGIASGVDVGFSNWGLELVTVSLYTMTKSTTIIFILICAILLKLEQKSWSLFSIVVMISTGLTMFTYKATQFDALGFLLILFASFSSGVRWTFAQLLMQKSKMDMTNPIDMVYHMQPLMIASLLPFAIWIEGVPLANNCKTFRFVEWAPVLHIMALLLIGSTLAFVMELSEVLVITYTSSLTLSMAGVFKEMFILVLAVEWNGDQMSLINALGLVVCLCGIGTHVMHKISTISAKGLSSPSGRTYHIDDDYELSASLIEEEEQNDVRRRRLSSDVSSDEESDSQVLFNVLNRNNRYDK